MTGAICKCSGKKCPIADLMHELDNGALSDSCPIGEYKGQRRMENGCYVINDFCINLECKYYYVFEVCIDGKTILAPTERPITDEEREMVFKRGSYTFDFKSLGLDFYAGVQFIKGCYRFTTKKAAMEAIINSSLIKE